jgi:hypothetical protein
MTRLRLAAIAATTACALSLAGAGTAAAQDSSPSLTKQVAVKGTNKGKDFRGTYTISRFVSSGDQVFAVGKLTGTLKNRRVSRSGVRMPVETTRVAQSAQLPPLPGGCQVLNLRLGPLTLNLLGLVVRTNRINLRIDALPSTQPGGGLLGDLLCGLTNLLNPATAQASDLARGLSAILALVPRSA